MTQALWIAAAAIAALMLLTWLVSLVRKDASIADVAWGLGFVLVAWTVFLVAGQRGDPRSWLLLAMASLWGLRLALHLGRRNLGHGEDPRYRAMRKEHGERFGMVSLVTVFGVQGALMWLVSLPLQLGQTAPVQPLGLLAALGALLWLIGLVFESAGDWQLVQFKKDAANKGKILNTGLWRYTRHPNYFGDACVWWGIGLVAAETGVGAWGLIGSAVMTTLLVRVSGVKMTEAAMLKNNPAYAQYVASTSSFIPWLPRAEATKNA
jgi:steroid 5-alpha reductase family enzyme